MLTKLTYKKVNIFIPVIGLWASNSTNVYGI